MEKLLLEKSWLEWEIEACSEAGRVMLLDAARQPRDELSMYSHPLAGCRRENSLSSGLAEFPF